MATDPVYDRIAKQYQASKQMPFRRYIEEPSLFKLLGDLHGKAVLDLACGEGIYTRKMKRHGVATILGVDISPKMIDLAESQEREQPIGCTYMVADASTLGRLGEFDVVDGVFHKPRIHFHLPSQHGLELRVHLIPRGNFFRALGQYRIFRNHAQLLLPRKDFFAQFIPPLVA